jgi:hypothetical protein
VPTNAGWLNRGRGAHGGATLARRTSLCVLAAAGTRLAASRQFAMAAR